jgi:ankyrin repeat protein
LLSISQRSKSKADTLKANPKLVDRKDDDERLPIHWATSYGHLDIAILLSAGKNFDPDVQVRFFFQNSF